MAHFSLVSSVPTDAWQISTSIIGEGEKVPSLTNFVVRSVEMHLARQKYPAGAWLGSVKDVQKQLAQFALPMHTA